MPLESLAYSLLPGRGSGVLDRVMLPRARAMAIKRSGREESALRKVTSDRQTLTKWPNIAIPLLANRQRHFFVSFSDEFAPFGIIALQVVGDHRLTENNTVVG